MKRVVVTGVGAVTPVGLDAPSTWASMLEGQSGIGKVTLFDASEYPVQIAGEVKGFDATGRIEPKELRRMDRYAQLGLVAAQEAFADAGLSKNGLLDDVDRVRTQVAAHRIEGTRQAIIGRKPREPAPLLAHPPPVNTVIAALKGRHGNAPQMLLRGSPAQRPGIHGL